jgi:hypothetical protein
LLVLLTLDFDFDFDFDFEIVADFGFLLGVGCVGLVADVGFDFEGVLLLGVGHV